MPMKTWEPAVSWTEAKHASVPSKTGLQPSKAPKAPSPRGWYFTSVVTKLAT